MLILNKEPLILKLSTQALMCMSVAKSIIGL